MSVLDCNSPTDNCTTVIVIQSLSTGQQPCSNGVNNEIFPEQAHFDTPTPPAPNTNSINTVSVIIMLENHFISRCKDTKNQETCKKRCASHRTHFTQTLKLLAEVAVHNDGHGAVVDEGHLHIGTEDARLHGLAEKIGKAPAKLLVHRHGKVGP